MSDAFGGLALPVPAPAAGQPFPDPLLDTTAAFCKAVLNAYAAAAWAIVAPGIPPVLATFLVDPKQDLIVDTALPALFVYRAEPAREVERLADDWLLERGILAVCWVPAPVSAEKRRVRLAAMNAVGKVLHARLEAARDPAWVAAGDTDPAAATLGSILSRFGGWMSMELLSVRRVPIAVTPPNSANLPPYDAVELLFEVEELLTIDTSALAAQTKLSAQIVSPDQGTGLGTATLEDALYT